MPIAGQPEQFLKEAKLAECLDALQSVVRNNPGDHKQRVFLFQLLAVLGKWEKAGNQLEVAAELNPGNLLMAQVCRQAILCEQLRAEVFAGKRSPLVLGEPEQWVGMMIQAAALSARNQEAAAEELRASALEQADASGGELDTASGATNKFEWIADADARLGPMIEAMVDGKYYWIPWKRIRQLKIEPPADLRDMVWAPAHFWWTSGGDSPALIPTRYHGSESDAQPGPVRLARTTVFTDPAGRDAPFPFGQRLFATDAGEFGVLETRLIRIGGGPELPSTTPLTMQADAELSAKMKAVAPGMKLSDFGKGSFEGKTEV